VKLIAHGGSGYGAIKAGAGADTIIAGSGGGEFSGGAGKDTFVFAPGAGHAVIRDFRSGVDVLQFQGVADTAVHIMKATELGTAGLLVTYDALDASVFLASVAKLGAADLLFV
jgi:Ca2+-binding RTX toxin-like protein